MLSNRNHSERMKGVSATVPATRPVTARGTTASTPTAMQQPAQLPASSSALHSDSVSCLDPLDQTVAMDECERDSDSDDDDDDDDDDEVGGAHQQQQPPTSPGGKRSKREMMADLRMRREKLRNDPTFSTPEERAAERDRYNSEKAKKKESDKRRRC